MKLKYIVRVGSLSGNKECYLDKSGLHRARSYGYSVAPNYSISDLAEELRRTPNTVDDDGFYVLEHPDYHGYSEFTRAVKEINTWNEFTQGETLYDKKHKRLLK